MFPDLEKLPPADYVSWSSHNHKHLTLKHIHNTKKYSLLQQLSFAEKPMVQDQKKIISKPY